MRKALARFAAVLAALVIVAVQATPAHAVTQDPPNWGTLIVGNGCPDYISVGPIQGRGWGCFERYGDRFYVYAGNMTDGTPRVYWTNDLKDAAGNWVPYRTGVCYGEYYADSTVVCNKDFYENSTVRSGGVSGSRIRFYYWDSNGSGSTTTVVNNA
ncbi:hypothetical protein [Dactylosporangium sp. NPDC005555]|uniref:hypothetical protein n=1 Tax=Dactylosporangium sp. NPDC005555 TaxID=3154889 RepID=UPI0033A455A5